MSAAPIATGARHSVAQLQRALRSTTKAVHSPGTEDARQLIAQLNKKPPRDYQSVSQRLDTFQQNGIPATTAQRDTATVEAENVAPNVSGPPAASVENKKTPPVTLANFLNLDWLSPYNQLLDPLVSMRDSLGKVGVSIPKLNQLVGPYNSARPSHIG